MPDKEALELYGIVNCDQVKKARHWLAEQGLQVVFYDFKKQPPTRLLLLQWLKHLSWEQLVNRRGTTWRQLAEEQRPVDEKTALDAMLQRPTLIKRPVLSYRGKLQVGFDETLYQTTFSQIRA